MPFSRRLSLAILSILLLTLITNGLAQPVHAQTTTVQANVVWLNGPAAKPTIWFKLYRQIVGGVVEEVPIEQAPIKELLTGTTTGAWVDVSTHDASTNPYTFSVKQGTWNTETSTFTEAVPPYYTATTSTDGLTITNTYAPNVTANKVWVNGPTARPTIWFKLYAQIEDGAVEEVPIAQAPLKELPNGTLTVTWENQTVEYADGNYYRFSVHEVDALGLPFKPTNYDKTEAGLTVTNTYVIPKTATATATKVWTYGPAIKPTIGFKLYRTSATVSTQTVPGVDVFDLPNGTSTATWIGLEATDLAGNAYTFSVHEGTWNATHDNFTEGAPTNYQKNESGLTVTNTYVSPKINIIGTKIWSGGPAAKPNIQIQLYRNGALMGSPYTLTSGFTSYTWSSVDQTDLNGATYLYTVDEVTVPAFYSKRVNGMTTTNTYTGTLPYTGDNTHNARWLALLLGLSALLPLMSWLDLKLLTRRRG